MQKFNYGNRFYNEALQTPDDEGLRKYFLEVYYLMSMGLLLTALAAWSVFSIPTLTSLMFDIGPEEQLIRITKMGWIITFAPLAVSLYFTLGINRITSQNAQMLFWLYSVLVGMSFASFGFIYTSYSIIKTFFICSAMFAGMSLYGYSTKNDLTSMGGFLFMSLVGLLIASLINILFLSPVLEFILSIIGVFIFIGLIAFDTQKLKELYYQGAVANNNIGILAAFTLYLDFLNLFLYLLRILGARRHTKK
jgi:FtsH-binding integral membrane protein